MSERIHHNSERENPRKKRLVRGLGYAGMAMSLAGIHAGVNIAQNQEIAASSEVRIDILAESIDPDNNNTAIVSIDGFNELDAENVSSSIGVGIQQAVDGQLWSVNYNNSLFDERAIARAIVRESIENDIDRVILNGYSAGGNISFSVYQELQQISSMKSDRSPESDSLPVTTSQLELPLVVVTATPNGIDRVKVHFQDQIELFNFLATHAPDLLYYDPARFIGELYYRQDVMQNDPIGTIIDSWDYVFNDKATPAWLLELQLQAIAESDLERVINDIGEYADNNNTPQPVVVYQTSVNGNEYMIDDIASSQDIQNYARQNGMPYFVNPVEGAVHTRPDLTVDAYLSSLALLAPDVQSAISRYDEDSQSDNNGALPFLVN